MKWVLHRAIQSLISAGHSLCTMTPLLLILLLSSLHATKATLDLDKLKEDVATKVQTLRDNAANNLKEFVDSIDYDKVKQLDVLNILPKVQRKVEFGKKLYLQKKQLGQVVLDYKRAKFNDKIMSLQKLAQIKQQGLQTLVEQKKKLASNLLDQKQKLVTALVEEKKQFVQDLVDHKKQKLAALLAPPPKKIIFVDHPIHPPPKVVFHESHHIPHKVVKIVEPWPKPWPLKKVIIRTKIYD